MASVERAYAANIGFIDHRMAKLGFSRNHIVEKAPTTHATLRSILDNGGRAILATYRKIAKVLEVDDVSQLYINDNSCPDIDPKDVPSQGLPIDVELDKDADTFDETQVSQIVAAIMKEAATEKSLIVINIILNSVTIRLSVAKEDIATLFATFATGALDDLQVIALSIHRDGAEVFVDNYLGPLLEKTHRIETRVRNDIVARLRSAVVTALPEFGNPLSWVHNLGPDKPEREMDTRGNTGNTADDLPAMFYRKADEQAD